MLAAMVRGSIGALPARATVVTTQGPRTTADRGEVTLAQKVRRRDAAILLRKMVRTVPGVVSVGSEPTWSEEDRPIPAT